MGKIIIDQFHYEELVKKASLFDAMKFHLIMATHYVTSDEQKIYFAPFGEDGNELNKKYHEEAEARKQILQRLSGSES